MVFIPLAACVERLSSMTLSVTNSHPKKTYIGIDPGKDGAISVVDQDSNILFREKFPLVGDQLEPGPMFDFFLKVHNTYLPDFAILEKDITRLSADDIADTEILMTVLQGDIVFDAEE